MNLIYTIVLIFWIIVMWRVSILATQYKYDRKRNVWEEDPKGRLISNILTLIMLVMAFILGFVA